MGWKRILAGAAVVIGSLGASVGQAFAADCYVVNKPTGAGTEGVFVTFAGTDFFTLPDAAGLDDADFGKALPSGARTSGPGDGCGHGIDSFELCGLP